MRSTFPKGPRQRHIPCGVSCCVLRLSSSDPKTSPKPGLTSQGCLTTPCPAANFALAEYKGSPEQPAIAPCLSRGSGPHLCLCPLAHRGEVHFSLRSPPAAHTLRSEFLCIALEQQRSRNGPETGPHSEGCLTTPCPATNFALAGYKGSPGQPAEAPCLSGGNWLDLYLGPLAHLVPNKKMNTKWHRNLPTGLSLCASSSICRA